MSSCSIPLFVGFTGLHVKLEHQRRCACKESVSVPDPTAKLFCSVPAALNSVGGHTQPPRYGSGCGWRLLIELGYIFRYVCERGGALSAPRAPSWVMGYDMTLSKNPASHDLVFFPKIKIQGSLQTQKDQTRIDITNKLKFELHGWRQTGRSKMFSISSRKQVPFQ